MDECDVVVPRDRIAAFVKHSVSIGREEGVRICSFGHAATAICTCTSARTDSRTRCGRMWWSA